MCGRVNVSDNEGVRLLLESLGMKTWPARRPRYNIAPSQTLDVVCLREESLMLEPMRWGVSLTMPGKSGNSVTRLIQNSRSDKVWTSPLWKPLIAHHRALLPVNGFYEWRRKNKKIEAAYYIRPADRPAMFMAAIYKETKDKDHVQALPEVSVMTTEANEAMSTVHDRMPVILNSHNAALTWLQADDRNDLIELMKPVDNTVLRFIEVSSFVNKSSNDGPECIEPIAV